MRFNFDVIFIAEFLWWKIITLIVQQILHKKNIAIPPRLPKDRFVFYSYISVVPQNEFAFQGIFVIATQFLKVIKEFSIKERDFSI